MTTKWDVAHISLLILVIIEGAYTFFSGSPLTPAQISILQSIIAALIGSSAVGAYNAAKKRAVTAHTC